MRGSADGATPAELMVAPLTQIEQHARAVARLSERAEQAHRAAQLATLDTDAYGVICAVMPVHLIPLQARLVQVLRLAGAELLATGDALKTVAATYEVADAEAAARHEAIAQRIAT